MSWYKCDACESCECYCKAPKYWGVANACPYNVGVSLNWKKSTSPIPKKKKDKIE